MNTGPKVVVLYGKALLEVLHAFLEVFHLFIAHADVVEGVRLGWALVRVLCLHLDGSFESGNRWLPLAQLVVNLALQEKGLCIIWLKLNRFNKQFLALLNVWLIASFLKEDASKFNHHFCVAGNELIGLGEVIDSILNV